MFIPSFFPPVSLFGLLTKVKTINLGNKSITVIVPTRDGNGVLNTVISSLRRQTIVLSRVVVIDDCSLVPVDIENVELIRNHTNIGKSKSINSILDTITTDFVCILDSDTILLDNNYLEEVLNTFISEKIVASCGMVVPYNRGIIPTVRYIDYLYGQSTYKKLQVLLKMVLVSAGCATIWRTSYIREHKIPTVTVIEDLDATWVAESLGYEISFTDKVKAYTQEPETAKQYYAQVRRWFSLVPSIMNIKTNARLRMLLGWFALEYVLQAVFVTTISFMVAKGEYDKVLLLCLVDILAITGVVIWKNYYALRIPIWKILLHLPFYYGYRFANNVIYAISLVSPKTRW